MSSTRSRICPICRLRARVRWCGSVNYSRDLRAESINVIAPVYDQDAQIIGFVRLSYQFATLAQLLARLRFAIGGILAVGLLGSLALALWLALNINRPLQRLTGAVYNLALGSRQLELGSKEPEEIDRLYTAVKFLVERLDDLEKGRRNLLANLVHELGRPLGAMRAMLQALLRGARQDPELTEVLVQGMDKEVVLLEHILDDLAHLYDQVLGTLEIDLRPVDLQDWLPQTLNSWTALAAEKQIQWQLNLPAHLPVIKADPLRFSQVIGNLLSNALKYTPAGGSVSVTANSAEDWVAVRVSDTGPGIAQADLEKIFVPFFRGEHSGRIKQGMGLGLSIARDLVKAHRGYIEVKSVVGVGSHFSVHLPVDPYPEQSTNP